MCEIKAGFGRKPDKVLFQNLHARIRELEAELAGLREAFAQTVPVTVYIDLNKVLAKTEAELAAEKLKRLCCGDPATLCPVCASEQASREVDEATAALKAEIEFSIGERCALRARLAVAERAFRYACVSLALRSNMKSSAEWRKSLMNEARRKIDAERLDVTPHGDTVAVGVEEKP